MSDHEVERCLEAFALRQPRDLPRGLAGEQLGRESGASLEFHEHRSYAPGDDLRRIDWSAYARSDQLVVRLHRDEVAATLDVIVDSSASMASTEAKRERALELVRLLEGLALKDRMDAGFRDSAHLERPRAATLSSRLEFGGERGLEALADAPLSWRRSGLRVLISDLLFTAPPRAIVRKAADGASSLVVIQLLDAAEIDPEDEGGRRFIDVESGALLDVQVDALARERYRSRLAAHQESWREELRQHRGSLAVVRAQDSLETVAREALLRSGLLEVRSA